MSTDNKFHIEKSISVGHIITTLVLLIGGIQYLSNFDKRIAAAEQDIEFLQQQRIEDARRIEKRLDSIDEKLDRILQGNK
jgi:cell division protein FtsB